MIAAGFPEIKLAEWFGCVVVGAPSWTYSDYPFPLRSRICSGAEGFERRAHIVQTISRLAKNPLRNDQYPSHPRHYEQPRGLQRCYLQAAEVCM
jgi:hypothetical protein